MIEKFHLSPLWLVHLYLITLLFLTFVSAGLFYLGDIRPAFFFVGLYSILVLRPETMPQIAIFIYGILFDILSGTPLGFYALSGLILFFVLENGRRFLTGQSWPMIWSGFIISYVLLLLIEIIVFRIFLGKPIDEVGIAGRLLLTSLSFPVCFIPLLWIDRWARQTEV
jgi:rod shape-determining protein MreD